MVEHWTLSHFLSVFFTSPKKRLTVVGLFKHSHPDAPPLLPPLKGRGVQLPVGGAGPSSALTSSCMFRLSSIWFYAWRICWSPLFPSLLPVLKFQMAATLSLDPRLMLEPHSELHSLYLRSCYNFNLEATSLLAANCSILRREKSSSSIRYS